jgi:xanthine/CO dehydrogenase XdhC/CoxF family maturation factor
MKELLRIAASLRDDPRPAVLATLVKAEGSSYRRTGARLLLRDPAPRIGSISGGCLEEDIAAHATQVLATGLPRTLVYDTTGENDLVWGAGLGCHGIVHVLLEPVTGLSPALSFIKESWARREAAVLVTAFAETTAAASTPPTTHAPPIATGPLLALAENGHTWSPAVPPVSALTDIARRQLLAGRSANLPLPGASNSAEIFVEYLPPPPALTLFGAGDDAQPLVRLASELGWLVTVIDSRPSYATPTRFPEAHVVRVSPPADAVSTASLDARSLVVVMTHRYLDDTPILRDLLLRPLGYLGLLGPKKRAEKILADLARDGLTISPEMRTRLHAPVGLDLGGGTPEEVALAILAEIQAVRSARDARPLRERTRPIHLDD